MSTFEAWRDPEGESITLAPPEEITRHRARGILSDEAALLYRFEAATREEAHAIHALRMGWEPYRPVGGHASCPQCGANYYPEGSAQCWRCAGAV
jgi:hypothetical protein